MISSMASCNRLSDFLASRAGWGPTVDSLLAFPGGPSVFGALVILDVVCCYLWLFSLYLNIKIGKNTFQMLG